MIMTETKLIQKAITKAVIAGDFKDIDLLISQKNEPDFIREIEAREEALNAATMQAKQKHEAEIARLQRAIKAEENRFLATLHPIAHEKTRLKKAREAIKSYLEQQNARLEPPRNPEGAYWDPNPNPLGPMNPDDCDFT